MAIDYSKFDKIDDQSDQSVTKPDAVKICGNCGKTPSSPLRCGNCKEAVYCSGECQKEDWQFHKRLCKKPNKIESQKNTQKTQSNKTVRPKNRSKSPPSPSSPLSWYRHREWKPENKLDFAPKPLSTDTSVSQPVIGSAWNAAGTWEEKEMSGFAKNWLNENIPGIEKVTVDASIPLVRGKHRYLFDAQFDCTFEGKKFNVSDFSDSECQPSVKTNNGQSILPQFLQFLKKKRQDFIKIYQTSKDL